MKKSTKIIWTAAIASLMLTACPAYGPGPEYVICYYGPGPDIQDNSGDYIDQIAQDNNQIIDQGLVINGDSANGFE